MQYGFLSVEEKQGEGQPSIRKGFNPMLVTRWETTPQGGCLLHFMGGGSLSLDKSQWASVASEFDSRKPEPSAEQTAKP